MRRRRQSAFTLIEVLVVMFIAGLLMTGAIASLRSIAKSELRSSSSKLAAAIRYCFDRAITTGSYYRIVIDLTDNQYWAERSDNRMYLGTQKEESPGKGVAFDWVAAEKKKDEEEKRAKEEFATHGSAAAALEPPPAPRRAKFATFKDTTLPQVKLKRTHLFDMYTPRQREPYTTGRAYLYFFPDGHTERAMIHLNDGEDFYTLIVHPLTGRVEVKNGKLDVPPNLDTVGEDGNTVAPR